ncbi:hypothetical protein [Planomonospora venezuelensis]|uniref:Uncharacterized protein n=1 Tax=Planomonospora venezuelensis TaxID=1999 RepID=A0A841D3J8_PLAVE|nr:hypothetical protein [Planomonospora venezuelensis]MBB5962947.1 hypothetical protein [Planomonospora venezuelensis]GIN04564.1 hypothetical protein Pve01_62220 [Planomonospora venezuelensis]
MIDMKVRRLLGAAAVVASLALAVPCGTAMAEGALWERVQTQVGPNGASLKVVRAYSDGAGGVVFEELNYTAGRGGAKTDRTVSAAGGRSPAGAPLRTGKGATPRR